jgi:hypothetical protein
MKKRINDFLNYLCVMKNITTDVALANALDVPPPVISKLRSCTLAARSMIILKIHDAFGMSIKDIKAAIGEPPTPKEVAENIAARRKNRFATV